MKVLLASLLSSAILLGSASAVTTPVQTLPEAPTRFADVVDTTNPQKTILSGAYRIPVKVSDTEDRTALVYFSPDYQQTQGFIMIVPSSKMTAEQCLEKGGWKDIADENGLFLMILESQDGKMEFGDNLEYIKAATKAANDRTYWFEVKCRRYLVGYGDSTDLVARYGLKDNASNFAGVVTFGDLTVSPEDIQKDMDMPVWMFMTKKDNETALIEQMIERNDCKTDEVLSSAEATEIYMPNQQGTDLRLNSQPLSQVRVTVARDAAKLNPEYSAAAYNFMSKGTREVGYGTPSMRYTHDAEDWGATVETVEIDGVTRKWLQYVPTKLRETSDGKVPLMVALHGNALNGEYFAERTDFIRMAEEYGFVIVFPTGSMSNGSSPTWNKDRNPNEWDDVKFIDTMINTVCENLPIDTSRLYLYGHSMGGMTTQALISYMDGRFAAAAGTGCAKEDCIPEGLEHKYQTPIFVIMGENDLFGTSYESADAKYFIDYFSKYNDTTTEPTCYRMGRFQNYTFTNADGVPMVRWTLADEMPHTATLDEGMQIFEFLSQFSRGADGSVIYQGGIHNAK